MNDDALIQPAAAAKALEINRSTLSRQIAQGKVRSHDGMVRLSEVRADRAANLHPGRMLARKPLMPDQTAPAEHVLHGAAGQPLARGAMEGVTRNDLAAAVAGEIIARAAPIAAALAVDAGVPLVDAYAVADSIVLELTIAAESVFADLGVPVADEWSDRTMDNADAPDWPALARPLGEVVDERAWHLNAVDLTPVSAAEEARQATRKGIILSPTARAQRQALRQRWVQEGRG